MSIPPAGKDLESLVARRVNIKIVGVFVCGIVVGAAATYLIVRPTPARHPLAMSDEEYEQAAARAKKIQSASFLRGVAQAIMLKSQRDDAWRPPGSEAELIEELVAEDFLPTNFLEPWPGGDGRPPGEPPFYLVGTVEDVARLDGTAVLLYEHPSHHGGDGGSVVYADTRTETFDGEAFTAAIAALRSE